MATPQKRMALTHAQILALNDILDDPWAPQIQPPELRTEVLELRRLVNQELYPEALSRPI